MHLPPLPRFLVRWSIRAVLIVIFLGIPAAILYLREYGIGFGLKDRVAEALSGEAFRTTIGRLTFDPFRGLIAENVEVVDAKSERSKLARIERLVVSININNLLNRRVTVDLIELNETDVSIPLGSEPHSERLTLSGVSAQCLFQPDQVRISYFEGSVQGVRVMLSGLLQNPQAFRLAHGVSAPGAENRREFLGDVVETLSRLKFPGQKPELRGEISGDLSDLSTLQVSSITLRSGPIMGEKWRVESLEADAEYAGRALNVEQFVIRGQEGSLTASAQLKNETLDFEVASSLGAGPFLGLLPKKSPLAKLKFLEAPQFDAVGKLKFSSKPIGYFITGSLRCGKFTFDGVKFDAFSANYACRDGKFFVQDARLAAPEGEAKAEVLTAPDDFRLRLANSIAPTKFAPLLGPKEQDFLQTMQFRDAPYVQLDLRGKSPDFASISGTGYLKLGRTAMRDVWLDWAKSKIEIANRAITYRDFSLGKGKGMGRGTFTYDFAGQQVRLENVDSSMPPVDVMMWIDPKIAAVIKPYRFHQPPKVHVDGMIHLKDPTRNALSLNIVSAEGLDYDLLKRTLNFGRTLADVDVIGTKVHANIKSAKLMEGDVGIKAIVSIVASDPTFGADIDIRRVNFAQLTKLYFDYDDSLGVGSGKFKFTARMGEEEKMRGEGSLRVEDGHVFAIPILGPLSDIINKIIPGAGFQTARLATADFKVAEERITTKNLVIEGAGFSLYGYGDIFFVTDKMDMSVRINARGLPGIVLFPVSKLFEYVSTGSVSHPEWRPKIIPRFGNGGSGN